MYSLIILNLIKLPPFVWTALPIPARYDEVFAAISKPRRQPLRRNRFQELKFVLKRKLRVKKGYTHTTTTPLLTNRNGRKEKSQQLVILHDIITSAN